MNTETEIWEVETRDGVYQADLPTLKQWVAEGLVLPTDRVRKGALKWIEAGRAPMLRRVFAGEERVEIVAPTPQAEHVGGGQHAWAPPPPPPESSPDMGLAGDDAPPTAAGPAPHSSAGPAPDSFAGPAPDSSCHFHAAQAATLVCRACGATFCRACPNRVGTSGVLLCALCGGFCDSLEALTEKLELYRRQSEGFGVEDFWTALAYPFRHLASLLGGALLYGLLLLAGMRAQILAFALVFGCIALVVRRVAYGDLKRDFLPDFSEFSFWDDVVVPSSLGLGVTFVTFAPVLILVGMLVFGWMSGSKPQLLPTDHPALAAAEGREMKDEPYITPEEFRVLTEGGTDEQKLEVAKKIQAMGPGAQRLEAGPGGEEHAAVYAYRLLLAHPGLVLLLGLLALGWAVFYYPMALLVAGWTESLKSVLNPLVGLDTIRHMGSNYFKAFLMYLCVQVGALVLYVGVGLLTAPFELPLLGNLPGTFLSGVVTFYTSLVVACILGLALFKSADRLGIEI